MRERKLIFSLNLGTDTSKEGRLVTKTLFKVLNNIEINKKDSILEVIFKLSRKINFMENTINHDLFLESLELNLKNIKYSMLDSTFNKEKYIENNQISINFINRYKNCPGKFYSGILLWLIVLVAALFQKQKWYMKIAMMLMIVLFILVVGYIGLLLPTIGTPWVNYFLYPILQIIFFISFLDIKLT